MNFAHQPPTLYLASFLNPQSDKKCAFYPDGAMVVHRGKIAFLGAKTRVPAKYRQLIPVELGVAMPAFFDLHFHWVQDDVRLKGKNSLLTWLKRDAWPAEGKFQDESYSEKKAQRFFKELSQNGTLGGAIYSSIHGHALEHALKYAHGDFIAGNVLMTMNSPSYLTQTHTKALKLCQQMASKYRGRYAFTPRFALSTHPDVMKKGAKVARQNRSFIQTHLSETPSEVQATLDLFRQFKGLEKVSSYTEIYKKCQLLGKRTIMGHGIYLSEQEWQWLAKSKTAVAHCPTSNAPVKNKGLGSGLFNFKVAEKHGVAWALGSDIGAGPYLSMLDVIHSFVWQNQKKGIPEATYTKGLYRATLASAKILGREKYCGNLATGKWANFVALKGPRPMGGDAEAFLSAYCRKRAKRRSHFSTCLSHVYYRGQRV